MRIISGEFGGRRLKSLSGDNTRPTSDKVKESIFNIIGPYFEGGHVLDLYAGSGGLAIEAVSRGCESALLFDTNRAAIAVIKENIRITKAEEKFKVVNQDGLAYLTNPNHAEKDRQFSLVFLDPPYAKQTVEKDLMQLLEMDLLESEALVVCEVDKQINLPDKIGTLEVFREATYGISHLYFYQMEEVND